jgi:alkaline phosphatase
MHVKLFALFILTGLQLSLQGQSLFIDKALSANDHKRKNPLFEALNLGYNGISAELKLKKNGILYCGNKTLKELYLEPLKLRSENGTKYIHPSYTEEFLIYLDVVSDSNATYQALLIEIEPYKNMLTSFEGTKRNKKPVRIVLGKNVPFASLYTSPQRYLFAQESALNIDASRNETYCLFANLSLKDTYKWNGVKNMPNMEYLSLIAHVKTVHKAGRLIRIHNLPELPNAFDIIYGSGVDLLDIEDIASFAAYWHKRKSK